MFFDYCSERLTIQRLGPPALVIVGASQLAAQSWRSVVADAFLAIVLLAQFRIWDDVADRERDAITHPERVTVRATTLVPLVVASALMGLGGFAIVVLRSSSPATANALAGLNLMMALWYWGRGARSLLGDHVLLAKYPMFVLIIVLSRRATLTPPLWLAMSATFLAACVYEAAHDRTSPGSRQPVVLLCETVLLLLTLVACGVRL